MAKPQDATAAPSKAAASPPETFAGGIVSCDRQFAKSVRAVLAAAPQIFNLQVFETAGEARAVLASRDTMDPPRRIGFVLIDGRQDAERAVATAANLLTVAPPVSMVIAGTVDMAADHTFVRQAFALGATDVVAGPPWSSDLLAHALSRAAWQTVALDASATMNVAEASAPWGERPDRNLLAEVGHEMRAPLGTIIGFAQSIEQEALGPIVNAPEQYRDYARTIRTSGEHLLALFDDLLEVGAACARSIATGETLAPSAIITQSAALVRGSIDAAKLNLHISTVADTPPVPGNGTLVQQAVLNLLQNAIKFTPLGGNIWLAVEDGPPPCITVRDDGIGIESAILPLLRKGWSTPPAPSTGDFGLGLAFVHRVAAAHHGRLSIDSAVGQGTVARLLLPTQPHQTAEPQASASGVTG